MTDSPSPLKRYIVVVALLAVALVIAGLWYFRPAFIPGNKAVHEGEIVSFTIPSGMVVEQYGLRTTLVGRMEEDTFLPLVDAVQYRQDPDGPAIATYDAFLRAQLLALCGSDAETVSCTNVAGIPYTAPDGTVGEEYTLTMIRTSPTGAVNESVFGPVYAFNQSRAATENNPRQFKALLIYPSFTTYLKGIPAFDTLDEILETLVIEDGVTDVVGP